MELKLGKRPATVDRRDLLAGEFRTAPVHVPARFGHGDRVPAWGMLANDRLGDCVPAGACHETMLWTAEATGTPAPFADPEAVALYEAVGGYDPSDPSTDRGTDVRAALDYRLKTGVTDAAGGVHRIGAYVALEPGNFAELLEAVYVFSAVGIGFLFPGYAMDEFNAGKPWSYRGPGTNEGGHYVSVIGRPSAESVAVVTWGAVTRMTRRFYHEFCDEAWAILSPEMLDAASGRTIEGYDLAGLRAALGRITGTPQPTTASPASVQIPTTAAATAAAATPSTNLHSTTLLYP